MSFLEKVSWIKAKRTKKWTLNEKRIFSCSIYSIWISISFPLGTFSSLMHLQRENSFNSITILSFIRITMNELDPQISNTSEEQNPNSKIWTNFLQTFGPTLKWMKSHRIFLQAICVCFLFCLPGNIVTYVLHRRIQVGAYCNS